MILYFYYNSAISFRQVYKFHASITKRRHICLRNAFFSIKHASIFYTIFSLILEVPTFSTLFSRSEIVKPCLCKQRYLSELFEPFQSFPHRQLLPCPICFLASSYQYLQEPVLMFNLLWNIMNNIYYSNIGVTWKIKCRK